MDETYIQDATYEKVNFTQTPLIKGEYDNCVFKNCLLEGCDLSNFIFIDCIFQNCNMSLMQLHKTILRDIQFKGCKMLGLHFDTCHEFGLSFSIDGCQLNHSSFFGTKLKKTLFKNVQLHEADFTEADLTNAVFDNCDLAKAIFENTVLEKADFRTAFNYSFDPEMNSIKGAKFAVPAVCRLLDKYNIGIEE